MPKELTFNYHFGGDYTQDYYSEEEMAEALNMTVEELRAGLDGTEYGPCLNEDHRGYSFHLHPFASMGNGFLFTREVYIGNIQKYNIRQWLKKKNLYTVASKTFVSFSDLNLDESEFLSRLELYQKAWNNKDGSYHYSIRIYLESVEGGYHEWSE